MDILARTHLLFTRLRNRLGLYWHLIAGCAGIVLVFVAGIAGYMLIEGWNLLDSYYMVVITLATVGYQEVQPLSDAGRLFTSFLILGGVGIFLYIIGAFTQILVEGRLQILWGKRRMQKLIDSLKDHFIVCGYGRIGSVVVDQLRREGHPLVVIEKEPEIVERLAEEGTLHVSGDATSDEVLTAAGLLRARSLITALSQEAANVYVTLTARQLNPRLMIIARGDAGSHIARLERAGADRVVLPHLIGGIRMAQSVLRPSVTNVLELAMRGTIDWHMEEMTLEPGSELSGKKLAESGIRQRFNVIIISIQNAAGESVFNPGPDTILAAGDTLITVGQPESLKLLRAICANPA
jgi:voltage-gated potassium channel